MTKKREEEDRKREGERDWINREGEVVGKEIEE